jgi:hypothetical protein
LLTFGHCKIHLYVAHTAVLQAESDVYTLIAGDANAAIGICRALAALPRDIAHLGVDAVPMPAIRANTAASAHGSASMRAPPPKTKLPVVRREVPPAAKHAAAMHSPPSHDPDAVKCTGDDGNADSDDESADEDDAVDAKSGRSAAPRSSSAGWFGR